MNECPYCHQPMKEVVVPLMKLRHRKIYDAVVEGGPEGVAFTTLIKLVWPKSTPGAYVMLRVAVHEMNKKIALLGQRIVAMRGQDKSGRYYLINTGEK